MRLNDEEKETLYQCVIDNIVQVKKDAKLLKELKEKALNISDEECLAIVDNCEHLLELHQKKYKKLISLKEKILDNNDIYF